MPSYFSRKLLYSVRDIDVPRRSTPLGVRYLYVEAEKRGGRLDVRLGGRAFRRTDPFRKLIQPDRPPIGDGHIHPFQRLDRLFLTDLYVALSRRRESRRPTHQPRTGFNLEFRWDGSFVRWDPSEDLWRDGQ